MVRPRWTVAAGLILFLLPSAMAAQGTLTVEAALPITIDGTHSVEATDAHIWTQGDEGSLSLELSKANGTATRVIHRAFGYVHPEDPKMEVLWTQHVERRAIDLEGATLALQGRQDGFRLLVRDADAGLEPRTTSGLVATADGPREVYQHSDAALGVRLRPAADYAYRHTVPAGLMAVSATAGELDADGPLKVFVDEATLVLMRPDTLPETVRSHFRIETRPGTVYDPTTGDWLGPGTHEEYIDEYLVIDAAAATLRIRSAGAPVQLLAEQVGAQITGAALLPAAHGTVVVQQDDEEGPQTHGLEGQDLTLQGTFRFQASPARAEGRTEVDGDGEITMVQYGKVAATYDWTRAVATVTIGTLVLAAAAAVVKMVGGGVFAGYARVQGPKILEHPARSQVYDHVRANPGVGFTEISRALGLGESTLQYHLRVLERNDFVTQVKDGRHLRFFDRQSGLYSAGRKVAMSALRNRTTARVAAAILERPGIAQQDLATRLGVAASTVHWHIQRLHKVGLVDPRRDHPHTRYFAGEAWSTLPEQERSAVTA